MKQYDILSTIHRVFVSLNSAVPTPSVMLSRLSRAAQPDDGIRSQAQYPARLLPIIGNSNRGRKLGVFVMSRRAPRVGTGEPVDVYSEFDSFFQLTLLFFLVWDCL